MSRIVILSCVFFSIFNTSFTQSLYFPPKTGTTWETVSPASLGWCVTEIDSLYDFLQKGDTKAFILLKDGKIALEKYFGTFTQDSLWYWASAGKTLTGFAVGIAKHEGFLKLTDTSSKFLGTGWSGLTPEQEAKISIWNHITMTTGLNDAVSNPDCTDKTCLTFKADPGTRWAYHNAPYTLLDKIIAGSTGQTLNSYVAAKVKTPTGMNGLFVTLGDNNVFLSTARSMARFGLLLQAKGIWNGTVVLADSNYLKEMCNSSQALNKSYGYLTWLNGKASYMVPGSQVVIPFPMLPSAPADLYAALGKNGQYINVVPSKGLVLIRMGNEPQQGGGLVPTVFNDNIWKKLNKVMCDNASIFDSNLPTITMYPNPTTNTLEFGSNANILAVYIYNLEGKLVRFQNYGDALYDLNLKSGLYSVKITTEMGSTNKMLCVE